MDFTVGTFNLNNLFSRFNFKGEIASLRPVDKKIDSKTLYEFGEKDVFKIRTYKGRLVKAKEPKDTELIAERIKRMNLDVLAVQEAEDIDTLKQFNQEYLEELYPYQVLVEGNDPRLIDVGVLSKYRIGGITSWQKATHPDVPDELIFGRDLLEIEILHSKDKKLFTIFNTHLKSHFGEPGEDPEAGEQKRNLRRKRQAEIIAEIVKKRAKYDDNKSFIILGDMNDPYDSPYLEPFVKNPDLNLVNGLLNPEETRPPKKDTPPPSTKAWTHRYKPAGEPAQYALYDQIWLSPPLAEKLIGAKIDRRTKHSGDGSDHDPAWVTLQL